MSARLYPFENRSSLNHSGALASLFSAWFISIVFVGVK